MQIVVALLYYTGSLIRLFEARTISLTMVDVYTKPHFLAVWVYLSFFLLLFLTVYLSENNNRKLFIKMIISNSIVALIIFIVYPTYIIHNDYSFLQKDSPISFEVLSFVINNDVKSNCFPSLHIANALLATLFLFKLKNKWITLISSVWFLLMMWSVLSTGQHYFYDIIGGLLLSIVNYYGISYYFARSKKNKNL